MTVGSKRLVTVGMLMVVPLSAPERGWGEVTPVRR
jgi:hypothetical protein